MKSLKLAKSNFVFSGVDFPENCSTYNPPFTLNCLTSIWKNSGCALSGKEAPHTLSAQGRQIKYGSSDLTIA